MILTVALTITGFWMGGMFGMLVMGLFSHRGYRKGYHDAQRGHRVADAKPNTQEALSYTR